MAAFGLQRTGDVVAVMLKDRIIRFAHVRIPMTGATNGFRGLKTRHGGYGRPRTSGGRGTRWDRVRLNRLVGSIPVAPTLALAGPPVTPPSAISWSLPKGCRCGLRLCRLEQ